MMVDPPRSRTRATFVAGLAVTCGLSACSPSGVCPGADDGGDAPGEGGLEDGSWNVPPGPLTTIPLTGCGGPGYAATFSVGSEAFQLTLDTGSGTLAVASSTCSGCGVSPVYTPAASATDDQQSAMDSYAKGSWQGEIYTDSVQLVGTATVTMKLVAIDSESGFFSDAGCGLGTVPFAPQGIVGLGPAGLAQPNTDAFVTKLSAAGAAGGVLAFELCSSGGQLMVGGVDPVAAVLRGPAVYTPMTSSQYYSVALDDLALGDASLGFGATDFGQTTVDTGTSVMALPSAVFDALSAQVEGSAAFTAAFGSQSNWLGTTTCLSSFLSRDQLDAQLPTLTLTFPAPNGGTSTVTMTATRSYLAPTTSDGVMYYCSGVISTPVTGTILGSSIMLGQMVIFDLDVNQIGFAPQAYCP